MLSPLKMNFITLVSLTWLKEFRAAPHYVGAVNMKLNLSVLMVTGLAFIVAGCKPAANRTETQTPATPLATPSMPATAKVTFSDLAVPPKPMVTPMLLEHGKAVYSQNCVACHGVNGDGAGDAAAFLLPKPRNFVEAK